MGNNGKSKTKCKPVWIEIVSGMNAIWRILIIQEINKILRRQLNQR
jgi:hypothetical protein